MLNDFDPFHVAHDVVERVPNLHSCAADTRRTIGAAPVAHRSYVMTHGEDLPEIRHWRCSARTPERATAVTAVPFDTCR